MNPPGFFHTIACDILKYRVKKLESGRALLLLYFMPGRKKESKINLLPREEFLASTAGRILTWVLTTFRIIVIVTEMLVMIAFLSRFWLDARNTDLSENIQQKQAVLASSLDFEKEFKDVQARLQIFSDFTSGKDQLSKSLNSITSLLPPDVILENISFSNQGIEISGLSVSEVSIQQFTVNLKSDNNFKKVALGNIKTDEKVQALKFTINIIN